MRVAPFLLWLVCMLVLAGVGIQTHEHWSAGSMMVVVSLVAWRLGAFRAGWK